MAQKPLSRELAAESVEAVNTSGTVAAAATSLGIPDSTLRNRLRAAKTHYDLSPDWPTPPDGFKTAGVSTLYNKTTGTAIIEWVKLTADAKRQEEIFREVIDELTSSLPRLAPVSAPDYTTSSLMACYPIGDQHLGMLAWHEETGGQNYDLDIGEKLLTGAMDFLVGSTPSCDEAALIFLGDYMHYDSFSPETPTSKNQLDADGRFPQMVRVAIRTMRYLISAALRHHKHVRLIIETGNHDIASTVFLTSCMSNIYEDEPRLTVDTSPAHVHYFRFGKCLIGVHHGHGIKADKLPLVMAADCEFWSETVYRYWLTGHVHHLKITEYPGCTVESFRVLGPNDAWSQNKGYRSGRGMNAIVLHRDFGEVARYTVNPRMLSHESD